MRVTFYVHDHREHICGWYAELNHRRRIPGALMGYGQGIPHDLAQYVVEAAVGYERGFWGLVGRGATFKSMARKRTRPGRAIIADNRAELAESERLAGRHLAEWRAGVETPVSLALGRAEAQWCALRSCETLVFEWPSPAGTVTTGTIDRPVGAA